MEARGDLEHKRALRPAPSLNRIPFGDRPQPRPVSTPLDLSYGAGLRLLPARSQRPQYAEALGKEVQLRWANPTAEAPAWLRESFPSRRPPASRLWAFTTDSRGRVVRAFTADRQSIAAYAELQRQGAGTCPIEGVWPPTITPGKPAEPAHPYLLQLQGVEL